MSQNYKIQLRKLIPKLDQENLIKKSKALTKLVQMWKHKSHKGSIKFTVIHHQSLNSLFFSFTFLIFLPWTNGVSFIVLFISFSSKIQWHLNFGVQFFTLPLMCFYWPNLGLIEDNPEDIDQVKDIAVDKSFKTKNMGNNVEKGSSKGNGKHTCFVGICVGSIGKLLKKSQTS